MKEGDFQAEIAPVTVKTRKGENVVATDETPFGVDIERIPHLKPAFNAKGTVTAASSSSISDGAAAIVIASSAFAAEHGLKPLARIVAWSSHAQAPEWFTTAPAPAIRKAIEARRMEGGGRRPVRDQRGVRLRDDGRDEGPWASIRRASTSMAAPARSATRSAPRARG